MLQIKDDKIIINNDEKIYDIYDIAFVEVLKEEIDYKSYLYLLLILNLIIRIFNSSIYFDFYLVLSTSIIVLILNVDKKLFKYHLLISFKAFNQIKIPLEKKQLNEVYNLIKEFKINYQRIDKEVIKL